MLRSRQRKKRGGLSLLEVVLALGILLMSLAALSQLVSSGSRAASDSQLRTEAIIRCQSKLAEAIAGSLPLQAVTGARFEDDARWRWSLRIQQASVPGLLELEVTVVREGAAGDSIAEFSLRRLVRNPESFLRERVGEQSLQSVQQPPVKSEDPSTRNSDGKDSDR
jgi:type II secretory pathway pseudopilin PulG